MKVIRVGIQDVASGEVVWYDELFTPQEADALVAFAPEENWITVSTVGRAL